MRATTSGSRLAGLDVARAVAIVGMLVAHFVALDGTGGWLRVIARAANGKAMPLFVVLGGVSFTLLTRRAAHPVAVVLGRAAFLLAVGLVMSEHVPLIAVILHFYAAYFVVGLLVRRLPTPALPALAAAVMIAGAYTWQHVAPGADTYRGWQGWATLRHPMPLLSDLFVSGLYPVLPSFAFFVVGMWLGRLSLGDTTVARKIVVGGLLCTVVGFGLGGLLEQKLTDRSLIESRSGQLELTPKAAAIVRAFRPDPTEFEAFVDAEVRRRGESRRRILEDLVVAYERALHQAPMTRWFDTLGHGNMPAWVVGANGLAAFVIGASLLAMRVMPTVLRPVAALGRLALTAYVAQGAVLRWWYPKHALAVGFYGELWLVVAMTVAFMAFATSWLRVVRQGPVEAVLRVAGDASVAVRTGRQKHDGPPPGRVTASSQGER
ncbi:MAG: heparan-alpha-glucosaminide N-acetyltransferase domain-containing protein [Acidimicrobiia bacterium]